MEGLTMEFQAMGVLVGDPGLQGLHVAVGNSIQADDQPLGERGNARGGENLDNQREKKD